MSAETSGIDAFLNATCTCWGDGNRSWREWFKDVLLTLLDETESFSGKRPNCNSGWTDDLTAAYAQYIDPSVVLSWEEEEGEEGSRRPYKVDNKKFDDIGKRVMDRLIPT